MKKTTTALLIAFLLTSCLHQPKTTGGKGKPDTSHIQALWTETDTSGKLKPHLDSCFMVIKDTFKQSSIDTSAGKADMKWMKDTTIFIPLIDSSNKVIQWLPVGG
jgi:hypothetical protein